MSQVHVICNYEEMFLSIGVLDLKYVVRHLRDSLEFVFSCLLTKFCRSAPFRQMNYSRYSLDAITL